MVIKVLVVDDSALMRKMISDILESDTEIEVVDIAHNGKDALIKQEKYDPDVITMDVDMPVMGGIETVKEIMKNNPAPIIMVSALTEKGADITMDALQAGAVDFICKPSGLISIDIQKIGKEIIQKVKSSFNANISNESKQSKSLNIKEPVIEDSTILGEKIQTLLVDDSKFFIKTATDILKKYPDIEIVGTAENGIEAIEKFHEYRPDVIIMDIDMPEMNGVEASHQILKERFTPIIIFSNDTTNDMKNVKIALELGAVDYLSKPSEGMSLQSISKLFVQKIREANTQKNIKKHHKKNSSDGILLIGTSTGGPQTLCKLFPQFPENLPVGILLVQHMPPLFTKSLAERLDKISKIQVKEAEEGDVIKPGLALIAPGGFHMTVEEKTEHGRIMKYVSLNKKDRIHGVRPSVDITFTSAANAYGKNTVGILLTGMSQDGANSMGLIKAKGGYTIVQDKATSIIFGMPQAAIKLGVVDKVLPIESIPNHSVHKIKNIIGNAG